MLLFVDALLCSSVIAYFVYSAAIFVEFPTEHGSLPLLEVVDSWSTDSSLIAEVSRVRAGTTEDIECSGLGICNAHRGRCSCLHGYFSSNGSTTGPGEKGDCSYRNPHLSRFLSVTGD